MAILSAKVRGTRGAPKDIQNFALDREGWIANEQETFAKINDAKKNIEREREHGKNPHNLESEI